VGGETAVEHNSCQSCMENTRNLFEFVVEVGVKVEVFDHFLSSEKQKLHMFGRWVWNQSRTNNCRRAIN